MTCNEVVERLRIEEEERVAKKSKSRVPKAKSVQVKLFNTENKENESTSESSDQEEDDMKYTVWVICDPCDEYCCPKCIPPDADLSDDFYCPKCLDE